LCLAFLHLRSTLPQVYSSASCEPPARKAASASIRALALKPDYAEAYITLAEAYMISRRWEDAAVAAKNAAALRPNWSSPQCHLALAYLELGRYADCLAALDEDQRIRASNTLREDAGFDGVVFSHLDEGDAARRALSESALSPR
jgi:tetratricopeptide (TPR) repeat protein